MTSGLDIDRGKREREVWLSMYNGCNLMCWTWKAELKTVS